jgi:hypothetical protein
MRAKHDVLYRVMLARDLAYTMACADDTNRCEPAPLGTVAELLADYLADVAEQAEEEGTVAPVASIGGAR